MTESGCQSPENAENDACSDANFRKAEAPTICASHPQEFSAHRNEVQHRFAELSETLRRKQVLWQGWI